MRNCITDNGWALIMICFLSRRSWQFQIEGNRSLRDHVEIGFPNPAGLPRKLRFAQNPKDTREGPFYKPPLLKENDQL
jgi:hypothetical protein